MKNLKIAESKSNEKKDNTKTSALENMLENKGRYLISLIHTKNL